LLSAALWQAPAATLAQPVASETRAAADPSGDWRAMGRAGGRVAFHLGESSTFDNIDQGQMGQPARMSVEGRRVVVVIGADGALTFEGELSADGQTLTGAIRPSNQPQSSAQTLTFERGVFAPFVATPETEAVSGNWRGVLVAGGSEIPVTFSLGATSRMEGNVIAHLSVAGRRVTVTVPRAGGVFEGALSDDGAQLVGEWRQSGQTLPLTLQRGAATVRNRPQTPVAPFPYRAEEVGYDNPNRPGVHLAGTLTLPEGRGRFPAVILITGSGSQDRDETMLGHKPFLVIADYLTRRGFAVLRVDDPGVGGSRGANANDTSVDFASDVAAGVAYLRTRRDIDSRRIALLGHSEGGLIAPLVARDDPSLAGIILLAGPGVSGADILVEQVRAIVLSAGGSPALADAQADLQRQVVDALIASPDEATARANVGAVLRASPIAQSAPQQIDAKVDEVVTPWYRAFVAYDPAPTLRELRVPVLALLGEKDVQIVAAQHEPALRAALADNRRASVVVLPGHNHMFQTANTGAISEYAEIEHTMSDQTLAAMGDWLAALRPAPRSRR